MTVSPLRLGVDIGGTFTDLALVGPEGIRSWTKLSSTSDDYARAIVQGLDHMLAEARLRGPDLAEIVHATTVATNAILESKGPVTGLMTTAGFRDVLEIRRMRMPRLYDLTWQPPPPLVPRRLRMEVDERLDAQGRVVRPLNEASARDAIARLLQAGVTSVAVCLINSYQNAQHEERIGALLKELAPHVFVSLSSHVLPEIREYERTSTTVINAYVAPVVQSYLAMLQRELAQRQVTAPVLMMQSAGGMMSAQTAAERPIHVIESGPAAGVVGAASLAAAMDVRNAITLDMGGTTAKASVIEDSAVTPTQEYEVGGGIHLGARLHRGAGYLLRVPAIDIAEVGAGGGSIAWLDAAGALQVGPQSAGAVPGPACYGLGGTQPTLTDANVVLGYLNPTHLLGGALSIKAKLSHEAIQREIAAPLGLDVRAAAYGIHRVAVSRMTRAVRAVTVERGRSPGDFVLCAFGGSGPAHAAEMARELHMSQVLIPPLPGLFSALGLLCVDMTQHVVQTVLLPLQEVAQSAVRQRFQSVEAQLRAELDLLDGGTEAFTFQHLADVRYKGQSFELTVPANDLNPAAIIAAFEREHERTYGHTAAGDPVELVNVRIVATRPRAGEPFWGHDPGQGAAGGRQSSRQAYFGAEQGQIEVAVLGRHDLSAIPRAGPFIIEEYDSTIVVPPGCAAAVDDWQNVVITVGQEVGQ